MKNIFSAIRIGYCLLRARINAAVNEDKIIHMLSLQNPTCRILSPKLTDVILGEHVNILEDVELHGVNIHGYSYVSNGSVLRNATIGKFCSISSGVQIGLYRHPSRGMVSTYPAFYSDENPGCQIHFRDAKVFDDSVPKTEIANDVWVGANAIIPGGIRIGTGAIVAAGAVVVKDVPPYAVVAGNPAEVKRYRFADEQVAQLLESRWWDWPIDKIRERADEFLDIDQFLKRNGNSGSND